MISTQTFAEDMAAQTFAGQKFPFRPGPEQLEFDTANRSATITRVQGGEGLRAEGTEEDYIFLVLVRDGREKLGQLELAVDAIDRWLLAIGSEMRWGTYIQFVDRVGGPPTPEYESPERVLFGAQYQIREGRD